MARSFDPAVRADFDRYASRYDEMHKTSLGASGEAPEYFAEYKKHALVRLLGTDFTRPVLDFGCGIGNLTSLLVDSFPAVDGYDPSSESVDIARHRAPTARFFSEENLLPGDHYGAIVVANVLHHVPPAERPALLRRVSSRLAPGGRLVIFEHNPLNPLTRRAVSACPFDEGVVLLSPWEVVRLLRGCGLCHVTRDFIVFFPRFMAAMRPVEPSLRWLPLGAQVMAWGSR